MLKTYENLMSQIHFFLFLIQILPQKQIFLQLASDALTKIWMKFNPRSNVKKKDRFGDYNGEDFWMKSRRRQIISLPVFSIMMNDTRFISTKTRILETYLWIQIILHYAKPIQEVLQYNCNAY